MIPGQSDFPPEITPQMQNLYKERFTTEAEIKCSVHESLARNSERITNARVQYDRLQSELKSDSIISNSIRNIGEANLLLMFRVVAIAGLAQWAPDVLSGNPESMYNLLHEHIAITTFEQITTAYGYSHTGQDMSLVQDFALLRKIYRNFVFSYMKSRARLEVRIPGSAVSDAVKTNIYKRRRDVRKQLFIYTLLRLTGYFFKLKNRRKNTLQANGSRKDLIRAFDDPMMHSDDELANIPGPELTPTVYHIKTKEGRSNKYKKFSRNLDKADRTIPKSGQRYCLNFKSYNILVEANFF